MEKYIFFPIQACEMSNQGFMGVLNRFQAIVLSKNYSVTIKQATPPFSPCEIRNIGIFIRISLGLYLQVLGCTENICVRWEVVVPYTSQLIPTQILEENSGEPIKVGHSEGGGAKMEKYIFHPIQACEVSNQGFMGVLNRFQPLVLSKNHNVTVKQATPPLSPPAEIRITDIFKHISLVLYSGLLGGLKTFVCKGSRHSHFSYIHNTKYNPITAV